ncbi:hypothetical protein NDNC_0910 [Candidatus Nasuia deltocephalinicola]|nr:hypothetical protein QUR95_00280 [Candidatus Nasuia deltocephalinicola]BEH03925.1 hypothetical protein NDNC_0910 [Candidatus Nasuia deltocephalinicola]
MKKLLKILSKNKNMNYDNYNFLKKFIDNQGRIVFKKKYSKFLNNSIKKKIKVLIKKYRYLSIFPYCYKHNFRL